MALALPSISFAHGDHDRPTRQQRITLDQQEVRQLNRNGRLGLKRAINQVTSLGRNSKLVSVTVTGRVRGSMSLVELKVDGSIVDSEYMERGERRHRRPHHHSNRDRHRDHERRDRMDTVILNNHGRYSDGPWRLIVGQDVRVRSIVVTVKKKRRGDGHQHRNRQVRLGSYKVDKVVLDSKTFHVGHKNVSSVMVHSTKNSVEIERAWITYSNGQTERLWNLEGYVRENRTETAQVSNIRNRSVRSITIEAVSTKIHGSRAELVVYANVSGQDHDHDRPRRRR